MNFKSKITENKIPMFIMPMPQAHTVASGLLVNVGSRDERIPEEVGLAHAFEHMFFHGTKKFPDKKSLSEYIEEVGGIKNAFTGKEITFFYNQVPAGEFNRSVDMLSEQIQYSLIPEKKIIQEKQVIIQELNRLQDNPAQFIQELTWEHIFNGHPLGHMVLGNKESILGFKRNNFFEFMERYYHSGNYTFVVAGNVDENRAYEMFNNYFHKPSVSKRQRLSQSIKEREKSIIIYKKINQLHINLAVPIIGADFKTKICLDLFSIMIGSGSSSPLVDEIRNKRGLAYIARSHYYPGTDAGLFSIYTAIGSKNYKEINDIIFSVVERGKNDKQLLEKAKAFKLGRLTLNFENPLDIIVDAAFKTVFFDKPQGYEEITAAIQNITIEDINGVVDNLIKPQKFTFVLLSPEDWRL